MNRKGAIFSMHPTPSAQPISEAGQHFLLRPDVVFLNHGSFGARPRPVFETYQQWQRELEAQPVEFLGRRLPDLLRAARSHVAAFVGAQPENLVFVPNATHGMNIIARSLKLMPNDEVLLTNHEYGAVERTWRFICGQRGATLHTQPLPLPITTTDAFIDHLWQGVTERTRLLVISHITSPAALIFPIAEICQRAHAQGILVAVDGAHAPGQIPLALEQLGADLYVANLHKWLCAPVGAGFLYAQPEMQELLEPLVVSWGYEAITPGPSRFQDYFEWIGTDDPSAYLSAPAAIDFQANHDWPTVQAACHALAIAAQHQINALTGQAPIAPETWFGQMCAIALPPCDTAQLKSRLYDDHHIEVPIIEWSGRQFVRVSIQAYNSPADVQRLVDALTSLL
jgi:isopenicillin-N epimerase